MKYRIIKRKKIMTESLDMDYVKPFIYGEMEKSVDDYMHGFCHEWVLLNYKTGDEIFVITDYDYDIEDYAMTHCGLYRNKKYIDANGKHNDLEEVMVEFDYGDEMTVDYLTVEEFIDYLKDMRIV